MNTDKKKIIKYFVLLTVTLCFAAAILMRNKYPNFVGNIFAPGSVVSQTTVTGDLQNTDGRTNILVLGLDKRKPGNTSSGVLTDTIMVLSVDKDGKNPVLISIPRDLWLSETRSKINAVYSLTDQNVETVKDGVERVVGIPIHYYVIVGFDIFTDSVDAIGGVNIDVERAFEDPEYPVEGKEDVMPIKDRYMTVSFNAGNQKMNGETALQYARSRHSTNPEEQGDFARARRQQKVIVALKNDIFSVGTLLNPTRLTEIYNSFKENVDTDIALTEILIFYDRYADADMGEIKKIVLSNESYSEDSIGSGTLMSPDEEERELKYDKQYVLIPADKTYNQIHALIRSALFE